MLVSEWRRRVPALKAKKIEGTVSLAVARFALPIVRGQSPDVQLLQTAGNIELRLLTRAIGQHRFPPTMRSARVEGRRTKLVDSHLDGFRPEFLARTAFPRRLSAALRRVKFLSPDRRVGRGEVEITTVFAPDERYTFSDTSFPWCTCGLVQTGAGFGSGVMIGPRHLLTASHMVNWGPNNTAGWLRFTPLFFDGSAPFGSADGVTIYSWLKADSDHDGKISDTESAFDYVVVTLGSRLGEITGWMGARGYVEDWEGGAYWGHIGYPGDLAGGQRPAFVGYQGFEDDNEESTGGRDSREILHRIDVFPGQSGGPYFGWWSGEPWPRVVSIQSGQNQGGPGGPNTCAGGDPLPELVNYARTQDP